MSFFLYSQSQIPTVFNFDDTSICRSMYRGIHRKQAVEKTIFQQSASTDRTAGDINLSKAQER